jgi:hypothetical protein
MTEILNFNEGLPEYGGLIISGSGGFGSTGLAVVLPD